MVKGAAWMTLLMITNRVIGLISTIILARLLLPDDFGIVVMCSSVVGGLAIFTAFGFDIALIQKQDATRSHYDTAWTFKVLLGILVATCIALAAYPTSLFYREPRVILPMIVLGLAFLLQSFENIRVVDFRKNLEFDKEAILRVSQKVVGFCTAIPLAYYLRSYWALIIGSFVFSLTNVILSYVLRPYKPRFTFSEKKSIFGFSSWLLLTNLLSYTRDTLSDFVIGRTAGAKSLGLLSVARELSSAPSMMMIASVNRAVYPGYAKMADRRQELKETYSRVISTIALIALPMGVGIASVSDQLVFVVLGEGWRDAGPVMKILALYGVLSALNSNIAYVFNAVGKPKLTTYMGFYQTGLMLPIMLILAWKFGILGAAWAFLITSSLTLPFVMGAARKLLQINLVQYVSFLLRPLGSSLLMYASVIMLENVFTGRISEFQLLALSVSLGVAVYLSSLLLFVLAFGSKTSTERVIYEQYVRPKLPRLGAHR